MKILQCIRYAVSMLEAVGKISKALCRLQKLLDSGLDAKTDAELIKGLGEILGRT